MDTIQQSFFLAAVCRSSNSPLSFNMADLVSLFEDIGLEPTKHVLEIEYPVRGILPPDTDPLLTPPAALGNREAPLLVGPSLTPRVKTPAFNGMPA